MSIFNNLIPSRSDSEKAATEENREPGPTIKPVYEIKETPEAFGLTVYLPGVAKDGLDLTAEENQFRIVGRRAWTQPESWTSLYRESRQASFELVLTHDNAVDTDKVAAELRDGVLRVSLPKHEALKPRKIAVN
jgi:HSP20 family molecular chaperone IbpA